jgi:hypothetical protein
MELVTFQKRWRRIPRSYPVARSEAPISYYVSAKALEFVRKRSLLLCEVFICCRIGKGMQG